MMQRLRRLRIASEVAVHRDGTAADDLADRPRPHVVAVVVDDPQRVERGRHADAARLALHVVAVEDRHEAFRQAVELMEAAGQQRFEAILVLAMWKDSYSVEDTYDLRKTTVTCND